MTCSGWGTPQRKKTKGKVKAGNGGAGGGPSTKVAAGSSGQAGSSQGSSRPSTTPARIIGLSTEEDAVQGTQTRSEQQRQCRLTEALLEALRQLAAAPHDGNALHAADAVSFSMN
jgi:hypothetical protein